MKLIACPLNGPRNIAEFICFGEVRESPETATDDDAWAAYVWQRDNRAAVVREWWCHLPTTFWFVAERDTRTGEILRTYHASELRR